MGTSPDTTCADNGADAAVPAPEPTVPTQESEISTPETVSKVARGDWVRGGTTSSEHDANEAALREDAEKRRAVQDSFFAGARLNPHEARLHSLKLFTRDNNASVVLEIMNPRSFTAAGWITCELTAEVTSNGEPDLILVIACPACFARRGTMAEAQVTLRQSHTKFVLDTRRAGEVWTNPSSLSEHVRLAGTITMSKWAKCPGLGCPMWFMIDDSKLYMERR